jgi:hypothetical protein
MTKSKKLAVLVARQRFADGGEAVEFYPPPEQQLPESMRGQVMAPADLTIRQRMANFLATAGGTRDETAVSRRFGEGVADVVGMTPVGIPMAYEETKRAMRSAQYPEAVINSVGMIPGARPASRAAVEVAKDVTARPSGTAGFRAYHGSPHDYPAERLVQLPDGRTEYLVGTPDALPDVPQGATIVQDFPLGRMRMDKIGTGEGAQAYGHGLYTAEVEGTARGYRDQLSLNRNQMSLVDRATGQPLAEDVPGYGPVQSFFNAYAHDMREGDRKHQIEQWATWKKNAEEKLKEWEDLRSNPQYADWIEEEIADRRKQIADWEAAQTLLPKITAKPVGRMYELNIKADPEQFLDWDKPYSQQTPHVREALDRIGLQPPEPFFAWNGYSGSIGIKAGDGTATHYASFTDLGGGRGVQAKVGRQDLGVYPNVETARAAAEARLKERNVVPEISGANVYGMVAGSRPDTLTGSSSPEAAKRLHEAGIKGIRYLDAGSRIAGEGTRNYVVFDENLIEILRKYGIVPAALGIGAASTGEASAETPKNSGGSVTDRARMVLSRKA